MCMDIITKKKLSINQIKIYRSVNKYAYHNGKSHCNKLDNVSLKNFYTINIYYYEKNHISYVRKVMYNLCFFSRKNNMCASIYCYCLYFCCAIIS